MKFLTLLNKKCLLLFYFSLTMLLTVQLSFGQSYSIHDSLYFTSQGADVLVYNNWYNSNFSDSKISGIELIHHGVRTVTNGDVRLEPTPEQWDAIPDFISREEIDGKIIAYSQYPDYDFPFQVQVYQQEDNIHLQVVLEKALPEELIDKAAFHLEFLPAAYKESAYIMGEKTGTFPLYPSGPTKLLANGDSQPMPISQGSSIVFAPENPQRRIQIESTTGILSLYDGRNEAQNGWYVLQEKLPANKTGIVAEWILDIHKESNWIKKPSIGHSQLGYLPNDEKIAVIELDKLDNRNDMAKLIRITPSGKEEIVYSSIPTSWGDWQRYHYLHFDFSTINTPGIYILEYDDARTHAFQIGDHIYETAWHPTLDVFFPVQMDHILVNEAYRVWHGSAHLDDALQAPVDHEHFDLYRQGSTTDTKYQPGEHIPGLNIGAWFDAGDYDIRTQTQYAAILGLVDIWERFQPSRDETLVDQDAKYVDIHVPDGKEDILQQIEHGVLGLVAQHRAFGRAINGIIVPDLSQYTHLGDGLTMTDGLIYNSKMSPLESNGLESGKFDDRWAFTSRSSAVNYGSIAAMTASYRALKEFNPVLASECLQFAKSAWKDETENGPFTFRHGNTTGGNLQTEKFRAAIELFITTGDIEYKQVIDQMLPERINRFNWNTQYLVKLIPYMNQEYKSTIQQKVIDYKKNLSLLEQANPYGVPIGMGGWAGGGWVLRQAANHFLLYDVFPDILEKKDVLKPLHYIYGNHPGSDISFVSGVGTHSKTVAYGMNRADYSFIAGGIVPGVLILKPDFPENKEDWPFLWGENEYVISLGAPYIYAVMGADQLAN